MKNKMEFRNPFEECYYTENAYRIIKNTVIRTNLYIIASACVLYAMKDPQDLEVFTTIMVLTFSLMSIFLVLMLESFGVSKRRLLFIFSETINFISWMYGFVVNPQDLELHVIVGIVSACGLQLIRNTKFENTLILLKLVMMWYILPKFLGYREPPRSYIPYFALIYLLTVLNSFFTYWKNIEEEHSIALEKLQRMKTQLYNIIQAMPDSVLIFSQRQEILLFNIACQELFQTDDSHLMKEKLSTLSYEYGIEDDRSLYEAILEYLNSDDMDGIILGSNVINDHHYEWRGNRSEWDSDKIIILTARDITPLISYQKAKDDSRTILLRTISHEIRTPTNTIINISDSLIKEDSENIDQLKIINISSKLLLNLINDLVDFSRIIANCFSINKCDVKLTDFIKDTHNLFSIQAYQKKLDYRYYIDPLLPETIFTDPNRLRQVLVNLLNNSLKFTISGLVKLEATLTEKSTMMIRVIDTGVGIPSHKLANLFEAFTRNSDPSLTSHGFGLGLYISNKFVKMLGDDCMKVESKLNEGSVFYFDVDIGINKRISIISSEDELNAMSTTQERCYQTIPRSIIKHESFSPIKPEILIVDDNEFNLMIMKSFLTSTGYYFEEARSGLEAVEKVIKANTVGLNLKVVVMDREMPGMTGPEATKEIFRLYAERMIAYIPIIIGYSSDDSEDSIRACEESGMKEFLCKTSSREAFLNVIRKYTDHL
jgi:signal transduction histidine kinase